MSGRGRGDLQQSGRAGGGRRGGRNAGAETGARGGGRRGGRGGYQGRGRFQQNRGRGRRGKPAFEGPQKIGKEGRKTGANESDQAPSYRPLGSALTIEEIESDSLTKTARENWAAEEPAAYSAELVAKIYAAELNGGKPQPPKLRRIMLLEISQYLENYLIPHFSQEASKEHLLSIVVMLNEKFRENVPAWEGFAAHQEHVPALFQQLYELDWMSLQLHERVAFLLFFIHAFQSLENELVSKQVLRMVQLQLWHSLSPGRLELERHLEERIDDKWRTLEKRAKKEAKKAADAGAAFTPPQNRPEATFIASLVDGFLEMLTSLSFEGAEVNSETAEASAGEGSVANGHANDGAAAGLKQQLLFCERFVEFMIDLMSQAPTRRYTHALLEDRAVLVKCRMSTLFQHERGQLFRQLVDLFQFYMAFPISNFESEPISDEESMAAQYARLQKLQLLLFYKHPALRDLALVNCGALATRKTLAEHLQDLPLPELQKLVAQELRLISPTDPWVDRPDFLQEVMLTAFERRKSQRDVINAMPLYPTEGILWDETQIPNVHYTGETCLALPKLNLQFLTAHDYLLRNFNLFRLEATYEIREDIADVLQRIGADRDDDDNLVFRGWARMAVPIQLFTIIEVGKPKVGENKPATVEADVVIDTTGMRGDVRGEWDGTKQHDVLFLLSIRPPDTQELQALRAEAEAAGGEGALPPPDKLYGLARVRGCEVIEVKDEEGTLMNDFSGRTKPNEVTAPEGFKRTITVALDTAQYQLDMDAMQETKCEDVYGTFNVLMRRKPKENNFKAVLESIRDLMNEDTSIPAWLTDIFLGYGDPAGAQYTNIAAETPEAFIRTVDFKDTFLDEQHLQDSFPGHEIEVVNNSGQESAVRPFRITFPPPPAKEASKGRKRKADDAADAAPAARPKLLAESYAPPDPGPYPQDKPPENPVRFTPVQVGAIMSGVQQGLTMVVGPPGTGKTDTAVQIMNVLYHNQPGQRTLLITHSNQALNDLFEKLLQRDVPARYLLRLGMGEAELATDDDFSRAGRVNTMLARRIQLLAEVERMAKQFKVAEDVAYTCETAAHFWLLHVLARWEKFLAQVKAGGNKPGSVKDCFPFKDYFADAGELFAGESYEADMEKARGCFRHLKTIFQELEECRAFELLKGQADRIKYLQTRQAKIVAMTCTHAALKRREFLDIGFKYDNLLMEESAQILEIESFIPMLLQKQEDGVSRLKRVILIGDHHQLPPVVKNMAFQKYSHLDQSLFTRFVRLGTPFVQLNAQGRARPSLAELYSWRYQQLGDLPNVVSSPEYARGNPGFAHDYQFIDVGDLHGRGESEPVPHFYQNLAEAEYVVSLFQYMRLRGYPANKISILTTYNGQKALLRDVIERRCAGHPAFGRPRTVQTVDKYQGQQNDYILLSLVRTRAVGHLRDVRRLVVAMSRSRLGLYVFGRQELFSNCYELQPTFRKLLARPTQLALLPTEYFQSCERPAAETGQPVMVAGLEQMASLVVAMANEWQVAVHNAAVAQQAAATAAAEKETAAPTDAMEVDNPETTEASAAPEAEAAEGMHVVEDLVEGIKEKPQ